MGRCKPLGSVNLFLSYASQLSGAKSCFLVHLKEWLMAASYIPPQQLPWGGESIPWITVLGHSFIFGGPKSQWPWHFLYIEMAGVTPSVVIIFRGVTSSFFPNTHGPLEKFAHIHHSCQVKGIGKDSTCQHTRGSHCSSLQGSGCLWTWNLPIWVQRRCWENLLQEVPCGHLAKVMASNSLSRSNSPDALLWK